MTVTVDMTDETEELTQDVGTLVNDLLDHAIQFMKLEDDIELSLTFVDNQRIQEINAQYREKDQPTDVISFALEELTEGEIEIISEEGPRVLGDIIVSLPKAREQAEAYGHTFQRELGFLTVHGLLHLLRFDHLTEQDEKEMFGLQEEILSTFGLKRFA